LHGVAVVSKWLLFGPKSSEYECVVLICRKRSKNPGLRKASATTNGSAPGASGTFSTLSERGIETYSCFQTENVGKKVRLIFLAATAQNPNEIN